MTEPSSRNHRYGHSGGGNEGRKHKRYFVADSSRGMLVHFNSRDFRRIDGFARADHRLHEGICLPVGHPPEIDSHQERRHLIIGNLSVTVTGYKEADFF